MYEINSTFQYNPKKNYKFENDLGSWSISLASWWEKEIKLIKEWNENIKQIKDGHLFEMFLPKCYLPNLETIKEVYYCSESAKKREEIIRSLTIPFLNLAEKVEKQFGSYRKICNHLLEIDLKLQEENLGLEQTKKEFEKIFSEPFQDNRHKIVDDLELYKSSISKREFVLGYVTKYQDEFSDFDQQQKLLFQIGKKIEVEEESEKVNHTYEGAFNEKYQISSRLSNKECNLLIDK